MTCFARILLIVACLAVAASVSEATSRKVVYSNHDYENDRIYLVPTAPDYIYSVGNRDAYDEIAKAVVEKIKKEGLSPSPGGPTGLDKEQFRLLRGKNSNQEVFVILNDSCIKCHKPGAAKPGIQLFTEDRTLFVDADPKKERVRRQRVYESIEGGEMPKGLSPLSADKKLKIKQWSEEVR